MSDFLQTPDQLDYLQQQVVQQPQPQPQQAGGTVSSTTTRPTLRFVAISLREPPTTHDTLTPQEAVPVERTAHVLVQVLPATVTVELLVSWTTPRQDDTPPTTLHIGDCLVLPRHMQPLLTPDDCTLAESIVHQSAWVKQVLEERYGIDPTTMAQTVVADPWSVHLARPEDVALVVQDNQTRNDDGTPFPHRRLVQTFLYQRIHGDITALQDNHYTHPIDIVPVVDLASQTVVAIDGLDQPPAPGTTSAQQENGTTTTVAPPPAVNYHRALVQDNTYLVPPTHPGPPLQPLHLVQPEGPSFVVTDPNVVTWQDWTLEVGFNYREGLVLHNVTFQGRSVLNRASLVEMAVPYGDHRPPAFVRKCAFDVGDYGLGTYKHIVVVAESDCTRKDSESEDMSYPNVCSDSESYD